MKKALILLTTAIVAASIAVGCSSNKNQKNNANQTDVQKESGNYVATLGEQKIPEDEFRYFLGMAKDNIEQRAGATDDASKKTLWSGKLGNQTAEEFAKDLALKNIQQYEIIFDKAKNEGYKADETEVKNNNSQFDTYVESLGKGEEGKKAYEKKYGISVDRAKTINSNLSVVEKYYNDQIKKLQASDEEMKKYYDENAQKYQQVTVRHVLFMTQDQSTGQALPQDKQDEAKKKAEDILKKVKAGADIAALAKQYSEDTGSKDNGGEYTFPRGQMVKEFEDWSFNAKVGDVGLVKTTYGYHVIKLEKILGFQDVKDTIKSAVISNKFDSMLEQWKKDTKYTLKKNDTVYNKIKVSE